MYKYLLKIGVIIYVLTGGSCLVAQDIVLSEPVDLTYDIGYKLVGYFGQKTLLYRRTERKHFIQSFDKDFEEEWKRPIEFEEQNGNVRPISIIQKDTLFYIFYYYSKAGKTHLHATVFDTAATPQATYPIASFKGFFSLGEDDLVFSDNKNYMTVYAPSNRGDLDVVVFDLVGQQTIWDKQLVYENLDYYQNFEQIVLTNEGILFVMYNQHNIRRKAEQHQLVLYQINQLGEQQRQLIPFHNFLTFDFKLVYDELNQQLVGAGFYGKRNDLVNGSFYFSVASGRSPQVSKQPFDDTLIRSLTGNRRKRIKGVRYLYAEQLILRKDGGVLLAGEQQYRFMNSGFYFVEDEPIRQTDYLYENILLVSIHPDGQRHWNEVLYKSQSSENDRARYSSFFVFKTNNSIRFLYNNKIAWNTSIFEYVLDVHGQVERRIIKHQEKKASILPLLSSSIQISANEMLTLSQRDGKLRLMKVCY